MEIRIATRTSKLAMAQTNMVKAMLLDKLPGCQVSILPYKTSGDRFLNKGLHEFQGKGAFTKEIEDALLRNDADLAVHSLKDLPTAMARGLKCIALLPRETPFDCFVSEKWQGFDDLPEHARIGTGSVRRVAQIKHLRPDIETVPIRGNVQTRLRKISQQGLDGVILAVAGLKRLNLDQVITQVLKPPHFIPAAGQGIIAVQSRQDWELSEAVRSALNDPRSEQEAAIERGILDALGGGCHAPVGVYAEAGSGYRVWAVAAINNRFMRTEQAFPLSETVENIVSAVTASLRG